MRVRVGVRVRILTLTLTLTLTQEDIGHTLKLACTPYHADGTKGIAKTLQPEP